jgi:hypothetical protein
MVRQLHFGPYYCPTLGTGGFRTADLVLSLVRHCLYLVSRNVNIMESRYYKVAELLSE